MAPCLLAAPAARKGAEGGVWAALPVGPMGDGPFPEAGFVSCSPTAGGFGPRLAAWKGDILMQGRDLVLLYIDLVLRVMSSPSLNG